MRPLLDQMERAFIFYKTKVQGLCEVAHWQKENRASGLIQRWARGTLVRKHIPLASHVPLEREVVRRMDRAVLGRPCFHR